MPRLCSVEGCNDAARRRGWCGKHYARFRRHGSPTAGRTPVGQCEDFFKKSLNMETDDCIEWPFGLTSAGYAMLNRGGKRLRVSRLVLTEKVGPSPSPRHQAAHKPKECHNPKCINYRHLRWATPSENQADKLIDGTDARGESHGNARLTRKDVLAIRSDARPMAEIAREYSLHPESVRNIKKRASWSWL